MGCGFRSQKTDSILEFSDLQTGEGPTKAMWRAGDRELYESRGKILDVDKIGLNGFLSE